MCYSQLTRLQLDESLIQMINICFVPSHKQNKQQNICNKIHLRIDKIKQHSHSAITHTFVK